MSWMNIATAARYAGVSRSTVQRWMKEGLKHSRLSSSNVKIHPNDIDAYIRSFETGIDVAAEAKAIMAKIRGGVR